MTGFIIFFILTLFSLSAYGNNLYDQGEQYLRQGDLTKAKQAFHQYYTQSPSSNRAPFALYKYTKLHTDTKNIIELLTFIERKYPFFPSLDKVLDQLGSLYFMMGHYEHSYRSYYKLFTHFSNSSLYGKASFYLAKILILKKQYQNARSFLKQVQHKLLKSRFYIPIRYQIGHTYFLENQYDKAISYYQSMIRSNPQTEMMPQILYQQGVCYLRLGKTAIGNKYFTYIVKKYPDSLESDLAQRQMKKNHSIVRSKLFQLPSKPIYSKPNMNRKKYSLQIGVYARKKNAQEMKLKIAQLGINCYVIVTKSKEKIYYKAIVGPFKTKKEIKQAAYYLSQKGIKSIIKIEP